MNHAKLRRAVVEPLEDRRLLTAVSTAFGGVPVPAGQVIEAENFDNGGESVAYHDTTAANLGVGGAAYRPGEGVDVQAGGSNGYDVGYAVAGEWLQYTVNIPATGMYTFQARVANTAIGGVFHASVDGVNCTGAMAVPNTGGWQTYQTVTSSQFQLASGIHVLRISLDHNASVPAVANLDYFKLVPASAPVTTGPFNGVAPGVNQTIEAENYDLGGEGVAYHDSSSVEQGVGGANYRPGQGVDVQAGGSNGYDVGYAVAGEWLNYTINVPQAGTYTLAASVANTAAGGTFHAAVNGANLTGAIAVPNTGGWQTYQTITSASFNLAAGVQVLHIALDHGASNTAVANFDWFKVVPVQSNPSWTQPLVWNTLQHTPQGLAEAQAEGVNGKLYVFGGYFTTTPDYQATTACEAYDPVANTWAQLAPMPVPSTHMGLASDGKYIYIAGAYTYDPKTTYQTFGTTNVWRYDIANNSWSAFVPLPAPRGAGALVILNNQLHFFDGVDKQQVPHTDHWVLDLGSANPQWITSTPTPFSRNHLSAAVLNGKIYAMGGRLSADDLSIPSADGLVWDPSHPAAWTPIANMPSARALAVSAVIDGRIVLAGGTSDSDNPLASVIAYDPTTNSWSNLTPLPATRLAPCGGVVGNELIITTGLSQTLQSTTWGAMVI
ncbi:MAG: N-acetylneuraminic acid mutarotase [Phycisphaerales bacterium]|nr:N-acetylneuraminic acid mutarotase [Phycisphaerales bacterium]